MDNLKKLITVRHIDINFNMVSERKLNTLHGKLVNMTNDRFVYTEF